MFSFRDNHRAIMSVTLSCQNLSNASIWKSIICNSIVYKMATMVGSVYRPDIYSGSVPEFQCKIVTNVFSVKIQRRLYLDPAVNVLSKTARRPQEGWGGGEQERSVDIATVCKLNQPPPRRHPTISRGTAPSVRKCTQPFILSSIVAQISESDI